VHRRTGAAVPDDRGFALIGDADGGEIGGGEAARSQRGVNDCLGVPPDFGWIVFDPSRLEVDLRMFLLRFADDTRRLIEDDEAGAGGALVDRPEKARRGKPPYLRP
jgi:hypothetical protein